MSRQSQDASPVSAEEVTYDLGSVEHTDRHPVPSYFDFARGLVGINPGDIPAQKSPDA